jgi:hypothetical protein
VNNCKTEDRETPLADKYREIANLWNLRRQLYGYVTSFLGTWLIIGVGFCYTV